MKLKIKFTDFQESNISGIYVTNPFWIEHLLNLFYQEYYGEFWCEVMDTKVNFKKMIEGIAYGMVENEFIKENLKNDK